jgi:hypothetical protein
MTKSDLETTVSESVSHEDSSALNAWNTAINELLDWRQDLSQLMDEGLLPPKSEIVDLACALALEMRDDGWLGPLRVVPDGEGGIVFERGDRYLFETIAIEANGQVEVLSFENSHLSARRVLRPPHVNRGNRMQEHSSILSCEGVLEDSTSASRSDVESLSGSMCLEPAA